MFEEIMSNVQAQKPFVHCITNYVTANDCANALLAIHGSPIMADDEEEVEEITTLCDALVLNIGTLNSRTILSMKKAGKRANTLNRPVVLDPVGAGASTLRTKMTYELLQDVKFAVIRGNISEIKTIYASSGTTKGVDADIKDEVTKENLEDTICLAQELSMRYGAKIAITGAIDIIADEQSAYVIYNGCAQMSTITGTGCMLSAMLGAYIAANPHQVLDATACCVAHMGFSGEIAYQRVLQEHGGTGSLHMYLLDALSTMTPGQLNGGLKIDIR